MSKGTTAELTTIDRGMSIPKFAKHIGISESALREMITMGEGPKILRVRDGIRPTLRITPPAAKAWLKGRYE